MADSKPRYPGLSIQMPVDALTTSVNEIKKKLVTDGQEMLEVVGVALLGKVQQAYVDKSRGGTGSDGIKWEPVQLGTLIARQRRTGRLVDLGAKDTKHAPASKTKGLGRLHKVNKVHAADADIYQQAIDAGAMKVVHGGKTKNKKGETVFKKGTIFGMVRDKKGSQKEALKKRITPGAGGYQIGVDTGLQIGTLQAGKKTKPGSTGPSLSYEPGAVVVAAATNYAEYFDKARPIIPDHLPEDWIKEFDELLEEFGSKAIETEFEKL